MASFQITITDEVKPNGERGVKIAAGGAGWDKTTPPTEAIKLGYGIVKILKEWGEKNGPVQELKAGSLALIDQHGGPSVHERPKPRLPMRRAPKGHR